LVTLYIRKNFSNSAKVESGFMNLNLGRSPPEPGKATLQGGLCASGAFKPSRPDQLNQLIMIWPKQSKVIGVQFGVQGDNRLEN
jgi:hypothetical protein